MAYNSNEIKVGMMLMATLVILAIFAVAIFGVDYGKETKEYFTYLKYVGGITNGSLVKYNGMDVGKIAEVKLPDDIASDNRIRLKLSVDINTPVRENSQAYITSIGIMTDNHIELSPGSPEAPMLPPGSTIDSKEVPGFTQMTEPLNQLSGTAEELMTRVADVFNDQNREHIASMLEQFDRVITQSSDDVLSMVANVDSLTESLAEISTELAGMLTDNRSNLDSTLAYIETTTRETNELINELRVTLIQARAMMSHNGSNFAEIMDNFQYAVLQNHQRAALVAGTKISTARKKTTIKAEGNWMRKLTGYMPVLLCITLVGCGSVPPTYYYRLDYGIDSPQSQNPDGLPVSVGITAFKSDLLYESEKIVYRDSKYEAKFYNYRKWIAPPRQLVVEKLVKEYRHANRFKRVVRLPASQPVDYILGGRLLSFEEWDEGNSWYGAVAISFCLMQPGSDEIIWEKTISERTPASTREPAEVVISINKSLDKVLQQSIEEISAFMASR
jgi:phospholipid/cholesterol/gamma-HCH transport system substrate-binding protein